MAAFIHKTKSAKWSLMLPTVASPSCLRSKLPGHGVAALTAYPELGCVGADYQVRTTWGIAKDIFCAGKDEVFTFLKDVFTEVLELFPSPYIHIGGDEAPKKSLACLPRLSGAHQSTRLGR